MIHSDLPVPRVGDSVLQFPPEMIPGKTPVQVLPLKQWTWEERSVLDQLLNKKVDSKIPDNEPTGFPKEPQYHVKHVPYNTGFKPGELIRLNLPYKFHISGFI